MESPAARAARTESLFRQVNERIAEKAEDSPNDQATFVCECADPRCAHPITAPLTEYEEVRSEPTLWVRKKVASQNRLIAVGFGPMFVNDLDGIRNCDDATATS